MLQVKDYLIAKNITAMLLNYKKKLIAIGAMSPVPQNQLGLFGPKTEAAVNAYKNKYLPSGNKGNNEGVVGDTTWAYIDRDYSKMTNSRQYQNEALIQANNNTDSNFNNTLKNLKNTNSPSPKPSSPKPSAVQTSPNRGVGNPTCPIWQKSDETYSMMIQNMLLQSTIKWYVASSQDERDKIVQDAEYIRDQASKGAGWWLEHAKKLTENTLDILNGWVGTPESISKFQRDELLEVVNIFQNITISNSNTNTRQGMGFIVGLFTGTSEEKIALKGVNSLIKESNTLVKVAEKAGSSEAVQREINSLVKQFISGNANPGIGSKHLINDIYYLRGREGSRVFYRVKDGVFEILGKASKENEQQVIDTVKKLYK